MKQSLTMTHQVVALLVLFVSGSSWAESVLPENIREGVLIPGSTSPDGKYCLLEVFHGNTTQNSVIIATVDRKTSLGVVKIATKWSTDSPHKGRTTIVWNPDSKRVAFHDSLPKHSKLFIYRFADSKFEQLPLHDLLASACGYFGFKKDRVSSSGQKPTKWPEGDLVHVEVSVRLKNGKRMRRNRPIHAPLEGPAIPQ